MKLSKLERKIKREARRDRRRGNITREEYNACVAICEDREKLEALNAQVEAEINPWNQEGLIGADWMEWLQNLWDWFQENWPAILEAIMTIMNIVPMFTDEEEK